MSKKSQILELFKEGKTVDEIVALGFEKKYIKKIIRANEKENNLAQREEIHEEISEDLGFEFDDSKDTIECEVLNTSREELKEVMNFLNRNTDKIKEINLNVILGESEEKDIYNPIKEIECVGKEKVREYLLTLTVEELREIIKEYIVDIEKSTNRLRVKNKIVDCILERL